MKIIDIKNKLIEYNKDNDIKKIINLLIKNQNEIHLCDLDLILLLISLKEYSYIDDNKLAILCDSNFISILAPNSFNNLVQSDERINNIKNEIKDNIYNDKLDSNVYDYIDNHDLINDIDLNILLSLENNLNNIKNNINIEINTPGIYSFALSQAGIRILDSVILTNTSNDDINNLTLRIISNPSFIIVSDINIPILKINQPIIISEFNISINYEELLKLNEKQVGDITFTLLSNETELKRLSNEMIYYSFDTLVEGLIPSSTALFATPNDEAVKNIIRLTQETFQKQTGDASLADYQLHDRKNVYDQAHALFDTLREQGIGYITIPASFEKIGQKIRIPHDVLKCKQGTCIDLAILFVSCLEEMGLNAGIVYITGHAYACLFLEEDHFLSSPYFDSTKALDLCDNEKSLIFIECTSITAGHSTSFEESVSIGRGNTQLHINDPYFKIIDITISRSIGFLPLPITFDDVEKITIDLKIAEQNKERLKKKSFNKSTDKINLTLSELNKFDLWEKKLLDLSKRNELIDFKVGKNGQQILTFDDNGVLNINYLYDAFKEKGKQYNIIDSGLNNNTNTLFIPDLTIEQYNVYSDAVKNQKLLIIKGKASLATSLKHFDRERKKAFEESGSNVLYLAIGFIEWFESSKSQKAKYSPIILIPIDLKRHSKDNYSIVGREEDPFLNISIFEYFHQEFQMNFDDLLTSNLFKADSNITAEAILNTVSLKLQKLNRARVIKTAAINIFRFSKAVMWQDMKYHRDKLASNKVIKSILDRSYIIKDNERLIDTIDDDSFNPSDLAIPLSADSSQIMAIKDCALGKSFILQGPPGTGKSQTITNMIVNAIYQGKTVLFVAEKMAALEVVQKRLEKLSLGIFALEAHSIKADKSSVMEQFKKRIELNKTISDTYKFNKTRDDLMKRKLELNKIINVLHKKNNYFLSFYDALVKSEGLDNYDLIALDDNYVKSLDDVKFNDHISLLIEFENQIIENGGYINNPFILYRNKNYYPKVTKAKFIDYTLKYKEAIINYKESLNFFNNENDLTVSLSRDINKNIYELLIDQDIKDIIPSLLNSNLANNKDIPYIISVGINLNNEIKELKDKYSISILDIDIEKAKFNYDKAKNSGFIKKIKLKKNCIKQIADLSKNPKDIKFDNLPKIYFFIDKINDDIKRFKALLSRYEMVFGMSYTYNVLDYDFKSFNEKYNKTISFYNRHSNINERLLNNIVSKYNSYTLKYYNELINNYSIINSLENNLITDLSFDFSLCDKYNFDYNDIINLIDKANLRIDYLRNWSYLISIYDKLVSNNLDFIIKYIEGDKYDYNKNELNLIYQKSIFNHIINSTIIDSNTSSFNAIELKHCCDEYKKLINEFNKETVIETASRITALTPVMTEKSASSSEIGILRAAINNKCRGKSLRQLFSEIPNILTKYFPVFLMSPISCCQFLDHNMPLFDIVIFDEASQMPTSEAIGAISRGKSLIVVGDSMQMPPTAFFQSKGNEDDYLDIDDQESILDDCNVIGMPTRQLDWHYRSKHESLIRFSNARFYNNSLVTFPSPNDMVSKVKLINTNGIYDRNKRNTNEIEANAVIKEIERRLNSDELSKRSIGVVTFSLAQQELIEDKLDDFWANNKELEEKYLKNVNDPDNPLEPIIVKNLENIQGDERDVILFSVCYGPDSLGTMYYQFGPVNKSGGEKRLNVAFSRARYEMIIFTSFDPAILSKMNSNSKGALELYNFLKYAKNGGNSLPINNNTLEEMPVGIERNVANDLEKLGYKAIVDVGKSSFRVDIGIIDPNNPNRYILGVICDSYSYERASTSRDRNIIEPTTLKILGWNLIRIWSFDYLDDPKLVVSNIVNRIKELENNSNEEFIEKIDNSIKVEFKSEEIKSLSFARKYLKYDEICDVSLDHKSIEFYDSIYNIVKKILKLEEPISYSTLCNRVANACLCKKAGSDFQNAVLEALKKLGAKTSRNGDKRFVWYSANTKLEYYRVLEGRDMDDIAKEEIIVAVKEVLLNHGPMAINDLKSLTANCFGIKYVKAKVNETMDYVLDYYLNNIDEKKNVLVIVDSNTRIALKENN